MPAGPARALLLDDDRTFRFFVRTALEEVGLVVTECASVAEALAALGSTRFHLIVTDLLLRNESGLDLLRALQARAAAIDDCRVVVLSGALDMPTCIRLAEFPIWRLLVKPVGLDQLQDCAREALAAAAPRVLPRPPALAPGARSLGLDAQHALMRHFAGDLALFLEFRDSCLAQFPHDWQACDKALATGDASRLHHLNHSLKTVLPMIGEPDLAALAAALDEASREADWPRITQLWPLLREGLQRRVLSGQAPVAAAPGQAFVDRPGSAA